MLEGFFVYSVFITLDIKGNQALLRTWSTIFKDFAKHFFKHFHAKNVVSRNRLERENFVAVIIIAVYFSVCIVSFPLVSLINTNHLGMT